MYVVYSILFLSVFALIGHFLWMLGAAFYQALASLFHTPGSKAIHAKMCPKCGCAWPEYLPSNVCGVCGWSIRLDSSPFYQQQTVKAGREKASFYLLKRIERFHLLGLLSDETTERLNEVLKTAVETAPATEPTRPEPSREAQSPPAPASVTSNRTTALPDAGSFADVARQRLDVEDRARAFRELLNPTRQETRAEPAAEAPPRRTLVDLLSAFYEERNIRWGELVGGLLIVGCSLALVMSFWSSISERPLLKFGLFNGLTAIIYALGLRAHSHWSLPNTARGLLVIALLLTPLNFLAVAAMGKGHAAESLTGLAATIAATGLFGLLAHRTGKILLAACPGHLAAGVMIPAASMLLIHRGLSLGSSATWLLVLGAIPLGTLCLVQSLAILKIPGEPAWDEQQGHMVLRLSGVCGFSSFVALGLVLFEGSRTGLGSHDFASLSPLAGLGFLTPGLALWQRLTDGPQSKTSSIRLVGTVITILGVCFTLSGIILAWPSPGPMIFVSLLNALSFLLIAIFFKMPASHIPVGLSLGFAWLLVGLKLTGHIDWSATSDTLHRQLSSNLAGLWLTPLAIGYTSFGYLALRRGRMLVAQSLCLVGGITSGLSIAVVFAGVFRVPPDHFGAALVSLVHAAAFLAFAVAFINRPLVPDSALVLPSTLGWLGRLLLFFGIRFAVIDTPLRDWFAYPTIAFLILDTTLTTILTWTLNGPWRDRDNPGLERVTRVIDLGSRAVSLLAACLILASISQGNTMALAKYSLAVSAIWLALAWRIGSAQVFNAAQGGIAFTACMVVSSTLQQQEWYEDSKNPLLDPWHLQAQGITLAILGLGWTALRGLVRRDGLQSPMVRRLAELIEIRPWSFDHAVRLLLVSLATGLAVYGALPGVVQELTPRSVGRIMHGVETEAGRVVVPIQAFEIGGIRHDHAYGRGGWLLIGAVGLMLVASQWERVVLWEWHACVILAFSAAALAAAAWEQSVAVATALRWTLALALLACSAALWNRDRLARFAIRLGLRLDDVSPDWAVSIRTAIFTMSGMIAALMLSWPVISSTTGDQFDSWFSGLLWYSILFSCALAFVAFGLSHNSTAEFARTRLGNDPTWLKPSGTLFGILSVAPVFMVVSFGFLANLANNPITGPDPASLFRQFGSLAANLPPILIVAASLLGFAIRERLSSFAFVSALAMNIAATMVCQSLALKNGTKLDEALICRIAQANIITSGLCSLAWLGAVVQSRRQRGESLAFVDRNLDILASLGGAVQIVLMLAVTGSLWENPGVPAWLPAAGGFLGLVALLVCAGSIAAISWVSRQRLSADLVGLGYVVLASFLSLLTLPGDKANGRAYHAMILFHAVAAVGPMLVMMARAGFDATRITLGVRQAMARWSVVSVVIFTLFALGRTEPVAPSYVWSVAVPIYAGLVLQGLFFLTGSFRHVPYAVAAMCLGASNILWRSNPAGPLPLQLAWGDVLPINVIALALPCPLWLWIERLVRCRPAASDSGPLPWADAGGASPYGSRMCHVIITRLALGLMILHTLVQIPQVVSGMGSRASDWVGWLALASLAVATLPTFWDARSRGSALVLYILGLLCCLWEIRCLPLDHHWRLWLGTIEIAAFNVATSFLWAFRGRVRNLLDQIHIPRREDASPTDELYWLVPANLLMALGVFVLSFRVVLTEPGIVFRHGAAQAALSQSLAIGLLAHGARRSQIQSISLISGILGVLAMAWSFLSPLQPDILLDRTALSMAVVIAMAILYGFGFSKILRRKNDWTDHAKSLEPWLLVIAGVIAITIFGFEVNSNLTQGVAPMSYFGIVVVSLTFLASIGPALVAAIVPGQDPLGLSERGRTAYVYASEILLVMLVGHLRLTMPWLFGDFFAKYWVPCIMFVSFLGVGLGELFRRQHRLLLARPLERTGAFLPILPLLAAFWLTPRPGEDVVYLLLMGVLYSVLAIMRSSLLVGALAAVAYNAAFWAFLHRWPGLGFQHHPQLWVIPPSLSLMLGSYLNRDRLTQYQRASIRYMASSAIYISSTVEIVLNGEGQAPWLPLVLAGLSIVGIFAGILLRIRGFLFLGTAFLCLAIFSMIWHAAVDMNQTWIWWVSGILTGVAILALFALFEKKHQEMIALVSKLKDWDA